MRRDKSIDILKFFAVFFVVNSHMDVCYPDKLRFLASGGAIGDALFFFISGYTLFLGKNDNFMSWYKRRLARILPSFIVCVLAYACFYGEGWYQAVGGYWFVRCILLYYVFLFLIRKYLFKHLWIPFCGVSMLSVVWWLLFENPHRSIYGGGYFMWSIYFLPMLSGAVVGLYRDTMRYCSVRDGILLAFSSISFWVTWRLGIRLDGCGWLQLISVVFLVVSIIFLYMFVHSRIIIGFSKFFVGRCMVFAGGLCLEVYLSHRVLLGDWLNGIFPLNLLVLSAGILLLAYVVRVFTRFLLQTFNDRADYEWRSIFFQ